jgi:hypothetical protein
MRRTRREEVNMRSAVNTFGKGFALAAVATLLVASQPAESRARGARRQNVPFTISSLGSPFGVQVQLAGAYTVNEKYVEVNVERALVYVSEHCPYQGRRLVNTLLVGLATRSPRGGWEMESRSLPVFVEQVLSPRDEHRLAGLQFRIPRNAKTDLRGRWLAVEAEEISLDGTDEDGGVKGYAFAHSRRDLFADFVTEPGR